jgi:hypothetical protein
MHFEDAGSGLGYDNYSQFRFRDIKRGIDLDLFN